MPAAVKAKSEWTGAEFDFKKKGKQRKLKISVNEIRYILRGAEGSDLQQEWEWLCQILKQRGIEDNPKFANNLAYIVGFALGNSPLSQVESCLIKEFPRISRYLDYWRSDFPKGWFYYRNGTKDANPNSTTFSPYYEKYLK